VVTRGAVVVGAVAGLVEHLGRQDHLLAPALEGHAQALLGAALLVDIGGVEEVDPAGQGRVHDLVHALLVHPDPEAVGAQPDGRDAHAGGAKLTIFHESGPP
jgi:hypothetical protein